MNVYDFDHTIYDGDCTVDFWIYCVTKYPYVLKYFPTACIYGIKFKLNVCNREKFKEAFYAYLTEIPDIFNEINCFWNSHLRKIKPFYFKQRRPSDLIISASPDFLIDEACNRLGVHCIASSVDPYTGHLTGPNCRGREKVIRFQRVFPNDFIDEFYSDSQSDIYMAQKAAHAFIIEGAKIKPWNLD